MRRAGTTLIELLVVISILATIGAATLPLLRSTARETARIRTKAASSRDVLAITALLNQSMRFNTLNDLALSGSNTLDFNRQLGFTTTCAASTTSVTIARDSWPATRAPDPTRDMLLLLNDSGTTWTSRPLLALDPALCSPSGVPAWRLSFLAVPDLARLVRVVSPARVRSYTSNGEVWLGLEGAGGAGNIQPFAGPFATNGVQFTADSTTLRLNLGWEIGNSLTTLHIQLARDQ